jgi:hypothetical protein
MENLYYLAPSDEIFNEVKEAAIKIWLTYDDKFGYATEKISRIENINNIKDNFMYIVAMFDFQNQIKLSSSLSLEAKLAIKERMLAGGTPEQFIVF